MLLSLRYPVFKRFTRTLPSLRGLPGDTMVDCVHASPELGGIPARYSTVLFVTDPSRAETIGLEGEYIYPYLLALVSL